MLIYIVDDNLDMCEFISFVLSDEGYRVRACHCPMQALAEMKDKQLQPTVLITDYNMPKMNGYELHQQVIAFAPELKTVVISGRCVQGLIGELPFLQKPFPPERLHKLIQTVTSSIE
ncbi:MAG: response regulator [Mariprofundus sp.]|nr:response regulator [Mariprofundus sp.]